MATFIEPVGLTTAEQAYLNEKLQEVSRSFALVVPSLEAPLRQHLATAYLLCRVVDNIEDSGQPFAWKNERFAEFERLLNEPQHAAGVLARWAGEDWPALTDAERRMMGGAEGLPLWQIYAAIPLPTRDKIRFWASLMAEGMKLLGDTNNPPFIVRYRDIEVLETEEDYNRYCYFVAGTVGHLVTDLVILHYDLAPDVAGSLRDRAESCGRALQKTNIIKDFVEDLERGFSYLPKTWLREADYAPLALKGASVEWKSRVLADVLQELREATAYLVSLPHRARGYRRAALLCLLPAYQTLLSAARQQAVLFTPAHQIKISHQTMAQCLADTEAMLFDDEAIRRYAHRVGAEIHNSFQVPAYR